MSFVTSLLGARRAGALLALCAATGAIVATAPSSAEACQPNRVEWAALTIDGATIPPDGLILFQPGNTSGWNVDSLIPEGTEPPDSSDQWVRQADVIAVTDASGVAMAGVLEKVRSWFAWRPTNDLPAGVYTVKWRPHEMREFASFDVEVSTAAEDELPTFEAEAITGTVPTDFADCDPMNMCAAPSVALSDVEVAVINVEATWSSELLRSQLEVTAEPSETASPRCVGCDKLDSIERLDHQSSYPITVEVRDLRSDAVVHSEQLDVPYAGPAFTTTPRDVGKAILASGCAAPKAELKDAWCTALSEACATDDSDGRCGELSATCGDDCEDCASDDTTAGCNASDGPKKGRAIDLALGLALLGLVWFRRGH